MLIPYKVDTFLDRWPISNWLIIGFTVWMHLWLTLGKPDWAGDLVLSDWNILGLVGFNFVHGSWLHLVGNMIFLYVFGNSVCSMIGNIAYPFVYVGLGVVSGAVQLWLDPVHVIGASGAINGIVGMFLCFYPRNRVSIAYWIVAVAGVFRVRSFWIILMWFLMDFVSAVSGLSDVTLTAYYCHIGGFVCGFLIGTALLLSNFVVFDFYQRPLFAPIGGKKKTQRLPGLSDAPMDPGTKIQSPGPSVIDKAPSARTAPSLVSAAKNATHGLRAGAINPNTDDIVIFKCECGKTISRSAKWAHAKVVCPGCLKTIEP